MKRKRDFKMVFMAVCFVLVLGCAGYLFKSFADEMIASYYDESGCE